MRNADLSSSLEDRATPTIDGFVCDYHPSMLTRDRSPSTAGCLLWMSDHSIRLLNGMICTLRRSLRTFDRLFRTTEGVTCWFKAPFETIRRPSRTIDRLFRTASGAKRTLSPSHGSPRRPLSLVYPGVFMAPLLLALGCSSPAMSSPDMAMVLDLAPPPDLAEPPICTDAPDGSPSPTFTNVQRIFTTTCAAISCHEPSGSIAPTGNMDLRAGHAYDSLVRHLADETCGGVRVVPGDAGVSYIYQKLSNPSPCKGAQMPVSELGSMPLPDCQVKLIQHWIEAGAKTD